MWKDRKNEICYVGAISVSRGAKEIVKSLDYIENVKLNLGGTFSEPMVFKEVQTYNSWGRVNYFGYINRKDVSGIFNRSKAGLVTLHHKESYKDALPVKMFEYMIAAIPVISSNNKLWKSIIDKHKCGICVNPLDSKEIADAIQYILDNPKEADKMGQNGKKAVLECYNWANEEKKLFEVYKELLDV